MSEKIIKPVLPVWLLIGCVGLIVGVSMGRTQSMGLYLPQVTQALGIGRESFAIAMAPIQLTMGLGAPLSGGLIDKFGAGCIVVLCTLTTVMGLWLMQTVTSASWLLAS